MQKFRQFSIIVFQTKFAIPIFNDLAFLNWRSPALIIVLTAEIIWKKSGFFSGIRDISLKFCSVYMTGFAKKRYIRTKFFN